MIYRKNLRKWKDHNPGKLRIIPYFNNTIIGIAAFAIVIISIILSSGNSLAVVSITNSSMVIPDYVQINTSFYLYFQAQTSLNMTINYSVYKDNALVCSSNNCTIQGYPYPATNIYTLVASDGNSTDAQNRSVNVTSPIVINILSPAGQYNSSSIAINASASSYASSCNYTLYNSSNMATLTQGTLNDLGQGDFYSNVTLGNGYYNVTVSCANNYGTAASSSSFLVYTGASSNSSPVVLSTGYNSSYSQFLGDIVTLSATTNIDSTCKYDVSDTDYYSMANTFTNTGTTSHSTQISGVSDGSYVYYVRCKNVTGTGVMNASAEISVQLSFTPTASITLSSSPPLKAGTYTVYLTTSEPVQSAPTLYYTLDTDQSQRYVSLAGAGTSWSGYIIIDQNTGEHVATFHFSANDNSNNVGSLISAGSIFLIDTIPPGSASSIEAVPQPDGTIRLKWYYSGTDAVRFNIYRSTSGGVDYVDYYDSTSGDNYVDSSVINGVTYYYTIAAVDTAGNDGALSSMVSATSQRTLQLQQSSSGSIQALAALDESLVPKVDQEVAQLNKMLLDVDADKASISRINDPAKLKILSVMGLEDNFNSATDSINSLISEANALKSKDLSSSDLDVSLNKIRLDAIKAESTLPQDIIIEGQSSYDQATQESDVVDAISQITSGYNLTRTILDNYTNVNNAVQDYVTVHTDITTFEIMYMGMQDYSRYTMLKKTITSSSDLGNVSVIETVPKSVANQASDITFDFANQTIPVVLQQDPVLEWDFASLHSQTIYYLVDNIVDMASAKNTRTIVLLKQDFKFSDTVGSAQGYSSGLTGFIWLESVSVGKLTFAQWMIILGIGMIIGLFAYSKLLDTQERKRVSQRLRSHNILSGRGNANKTQRASGPQNIAVSLHQKMYGSAGATLPKDVKQTAAPGLIQNAAHKNAQHGAVLNVLNASKALEEVNKSINSFNYERARRIYNECLNSPVSDKRMLDYVFLKLSAYKLIYSCRKHFSSKEYALARSDLSNLKSVSRQITQMLKSIDEDNLQEESKFANYVDNSRSHLESVIL